MMTFKSAKENYHTTVLLRLTWFCYLQRTKDTRGDNVVTTWSYVRVFGSTAV